MKDYPAIKVAIFFVTGILSQKFFSVSFEIIIIAFILISLAMLPAIKRLTRWKAEFFVSVTTFVMIVFVGNIIVQPFNAELRNPFEKIYRLKDAELTGTISKIDLRRKTELAFYTITDSIFTTGFRAKGNFKFLCRFKGPDESIRTLYERLKPGNKIKLKGIYYRGREERNPGEFDYDAYLRSQGITGIFLVDTISNVQILSGESFFFSNIIHQVRKAIDEQIRKYHSPQTASLLRGLLLADRREIDYETKTDFINAGVIHVLAVSGLHVGYIVLIFFLFLGRFNLLLRSGITVAGLICFMLLTGVPASVFRATLMAVILIVAFLLNRSTNLINSIAIAALIILCVSPEEIYNPGFQLSFSAVLSIAIIYPVIEKFILKTGIKSKLLKSFLLFTGVSLSAQVGTIPFTLLYFNKISTVALLTNLLVIPAIGIIIGVAVFTLILSVILPFLAVYYGAANDLFSSMILSVISFSGRTDFSHIVIHQYSIKDLIVFYLLAACLFIFFKKIKRIVPGLIFITVITGNIVLLSSLDDQELMPEGVLSIFMLDVGQGDSFLIKFPDGKTALIDAGNTTIYFDNGERVVLPLLNYLGIKKIDYAFISHIDSDHYAGFISLILEGRINQVFKPAVDTTLSKDLRFEKFLKDFNVPLYYYRQEKLDIGGVNLYILNFGKFIDSKELTTNDRSGVIKMVYGKNSFLFTGDIGRFAELEYAGKYRNFMDSDVLKVAHHGSQTSSSGEFLEFVTPGISLISAGINNNFGHPSEEVLIRLADLNSTVLRSDLQKAILLRSDGNKIKVVQWSDR